MPCGISKGLQTLPLRNMPQSTARYMPKLTRLQLSLARSITSYPFGWRILLGQQLLRAPITILLTLTSHRRGMYRHTRGCVLYELYAKALKKNKVAFKDRYFKLQIIVLATCNELFLQHGFTFMWLFNTQFIDLFSLWPITALPSLVPPAFTQLWASLAPAHLITAFQPRQTKPHWQIAFIHSPTLKQEKFKKKLW